MACPRRISRYWIFLSTFVFMKLAGISAATKAALSVVLVGLLQAQGTRLYGGGGWFWVQYSGLMGLGPVVDGLRAQGLSFSVPSGFAGIGGGGGGYLGRIHIGGEGGYFFGGKVGGGAGWARLGYFFPLRGGLIIMPVGIIGGGGLTLQIRDDGTAVSFGQIAATHVPIQSLSTGGMLTGAAIEVQRNLGGFLLGLSAGYLTGPSWKDWETAEGRRLTDGPRVSIGMPYVRLQIGGGGWASPEK
jgi:hypothetical protein